MEISPPEKKVSDGSEEAIPTEVTEKRNEVDTCRICQSPDEEPDNPLRHPCACRGSLKYAHQDCLFLWINRRQSKHCEICKRSYKVVPVYAKNAPKRLSCVEFSKGLLRRAFHFMTLFLPWLLMIPFNTYVSSLRFTNKESKRVFGLYHDFPGLFYTIEVVTNFTLIVVIRVLQEEIIRMRPELLRFLNFMEIDQIPRILLVFSTYMEILFDWWQNQLLQLPFLHIFKRGPLALLFVRRNVQLHEFGAIRRSLFMLDDNTFAVLAINIYWSFFNVLLPFSIGRIVLTLLRCFPYGWIWENVSEITIGSIVLLSLLLGFLRTLFPRRPRMIRRFSLSLKEELVLCFKIFLMPWLLGCWLDFCAFPITETLLSRKLEATFDYPVMATKHWFIGMFYLGFALRCMNMNLIQKIVHQRAFGYLLDVTEPNYRITKLYLRPVLFTFAFHGAMVVIVLHLPIKTISLINRSFFPLKFGVYKDEVVSGLLFAYICLVVAGPRWLTNFVQPSIEPIVYKWLVTVCSWLELSDFLLGEGFRRANQNVRPLFRVFGIVEGSIVSLYGRTPRNTTHEEDANDKRNRRFKLRIGLMLVLASLSMFLVSTTFMSLPILVGRTFFDSISFFMLSFGLECDDLCAFLIGFCIIRGLYIITRFFVYDNMSIRNIFLFSIWIIVIPGFLGRLIDLTIIIPSQTPRVCTSVSILVQNWLIGVVFLHIWIFLMTLALVFIWFSAKLTRDLVIYLHHVEFDKRYKVGEKLVDFVEESLKLQRPK